MDEVHVREKLRTFIINELIRDEDYQLQVDEKIITDAIAEFSLVFNMFNELFWSLRFRIWS